MEIVLVKEVGEEADLVCESPLVFLIGGWPGGQYFHW